jgi:hypothetical protein
MLPERMGHYQDIGKQNRRIEAEQSRRLRSRYRRGYQ